MSNLPAKTGQRTRLVPLRREIANVNARPERHLRHYSSGKVAVVNPKIKQKYAVVPVKIGSKPLQVRGVVLPSVSMLPAKDRTPVPDPADTREQEFIKLAERTLKDRLEDLYKLDAAIRADSEDPEYIENAQDKLNAYGLGMTYSEDRNSWIYQISWGGPSDEFEINEYGDVDYVYKDWFQGHRIRLAPVDAELIKSVTEWEQREDEGYKWIHGGIDEENGR